MANGSTKKRKCEERKRETTKKKDEEKKDRGGKLQQIGSSSQEQSSLVTSLLLCISVLFLARSYVFYNILSLNSGQTIFFQDDFKTIFLDVIELFRLTYLPKSSQCTHRTSGNMTKSILNP